MPSHTTPLARSGFKELNPRFSIRDAGVRGYICAQTSL